MQELQALFVGIGLAATCGFRVFVPLLGLSIASYTGYLPLSAGFDWVGTAPAIFAFGIATMLEIGAYYVPWLDNLLDTIASPIAVIAGILVTVSVLGELPPYMRWMLAVIAGGGAAGIVQLSSVFVRGTSTATTGGFGNPVIATIELVASIIGTIVSLVLPILAVIFVVAILVFILRRRMKQLPA